MFAITRSRCGTGNQSQYTDATRRINDIMMTLKAPFPWFGGKASIAPLVWERFGVVSNYVGYCLVDKIDLVMLHCVNETCMGTLRIDRPSNKSDQVYWDYISGQSTFSRTSKQSNYWRENTSRLLDSFSCFIGTTANLFYLGNRRRFKLAIAGAFLDFATSKNINESHGWWRRHTWLYSNTGTSSEMVRTAKRSFLSSWANSWNEGQNTFNGISAQNKCGRKRS